MVSTEQARLGSVDCLVQDDTTLTQLLAVYPPPHLTVMATSSLLLSTGLLALLAGVRKIKWQTII